MSVRILVGVLGMMTVSLGTVLAEEDRPAEVSLRCFAGPTWIRDHREGRHRMPGMGIKLEIEQVKWLRTKLGIESSDLALEGGARFGEEGGPGYSGSLSLIWPIGRRTLLALNAEQSREWRAEGEDRAERDLRTNLSWKSPLFCKLKGEGFVDSEENPDLETRRGGELMLEFPILEPELNRPGPTIKPSIGIGSYSSSEGGIEGSRVRYHVVRVELKKLKLFHKKLDFGSRALLEVPFYIENWERGEEDDLEDQPKKRTRIQGRANLEYVLLAAKNEQTVKVRLEGQLQWRGHPRRPARTDSRIGVRIIWTLPL